MALTTPKILLCTLAVGDRFREITKYATINKREYCQKHKYDFIEESNTLDPTKTIHWSKLILIQKHLSDYDYIVWMDSDLYIMNLTITLESFISRIMLDKDIMTGSDWKMSNTGTIFVKNTEWSKMFLQTWLNHTDYSRDGGNYEQDAFQDLYEKNILHAKEHIISSSPTEFNSYWFNYFDGHFILHMAGCHEENGLNTMMTNYCPVKRQEDTDESYQSRLEWLKEYRHEHR